MDTTNIEAPKLIVTVNDESMLYKLKDAIKKLNGVSSISIQKPRKTDIELAHDDIKKGRTTEWKSVDEMMDNVLGV